MIELLLREGLKTRDRYSILYSVLAMISWRIQLPSPTPTTPRTESSLIWIGLLKSTSCSLPHTARMKKEASRTTWDSSFSGIHHSRIGLSSIASDSLQSHLPSSTLSPTPQCLEAVITVRSCSGISVPSRCPFSVQVSLQMPTSTQYAPWMWLVLRSPTTSSHTPTTAWCVYGTSSSLASPHAWTNCPLAGHRGLKLPRHLLLIPPLLETARSVLIAHWFQIPHRFWTGPIKRKYMILTSPAAVSPWAMLITTTLVPSTVSSTRMPFIIRVMRRSPCSISTMGQSAASPSTTLPSSSYSITLFSLVHTTGPSSCGTPTPRTLCAHSKIPKTTSTMSTGIPLTPVCLPQSTTTATLISSTLLAIWKCLSPMKRWARTHKTAASGTTKVQPSFLETVLEASVSMA